MSTDATVVALLNLQPTLYQTPARQANLQSQSRAAQPFYATPISNLQSPISNLQSPISSPMLLAFNKPYGVLSQFNENPGEEGKQRTLAEFGFPDGFIPLGRLDLDSEGLLLFTDEPTLERELLHPSNSHEREYFVLVDGQPDSRALQTLQSGTLVIRGHPCRPAMASVIVEPKDIPPREPALTLTSHPVTTWLSLTLREGKNRQVRRMTAAVGHPTLRLIRYRIGNLTLTDLQLPVGEFRALNESEHARVFAN